MKYQYWKCTICSEEFRTGSSMSRFYLRDHLQKHKKESCELEKQDRDYGRELRVSDKKYPKRVMGFWIKNVTPPVERKLWKCKDCGEEMTYHYKYSHQQNNSVCPICNKEFPKSDKHQCTIRV